MKKYVLILSLIAVLLMQPSAIAASDETQGSYQNIEEAYHIIDHYFVEEPIIENMPELTVEAMVESLEDPYSEYFSGEEWNAFQSSIEQNYVGIGVQIEAGSEGVTILQVFENSPAAQAGLIPGDVFIKVDGQPVMESSVDELVSKVVGPEKTEVEVTVKRGDSELTQTMTRQKVQIPVLRKFYFEEDQVGYVRLYTFSEHIDEQLAESIQSMEANGMSALVLDLRDNGGGLLSSTAAIASLFVQEGVLIHTQIRGKQGDPVKIANGKEAPYPIKILVNENSASASEVLAGALRDHGKAELIGTKTYGKGSVQQVFQLSSGDYIKLTVEEYLTPKMHPVNGVGLEPDLVIHGGGAQVISALHHAGLNKMEVTLSDGIIEINEFALDDTLNMLQEQGQDYVPVRFLAALVQSDVRWNSETKSISLDNEQYSGEIKSNSAAAILKSGTNYVNVEAFHALFPQFSWETNATGELTFVIEKE